MKNIHTIITSAVVISCVCGESWSTLPEKEPSREEAFTPFSRSLDSIPRDVWQTQRTYMPEFAEKVSLVRKTVEEFFKVPDSATELERMKKHVEFLGAFLEVIPLYNNLLMSGKTILECEPESGKEGEETKIINTYFGEYFKFMLNWSNVDRDQYKYNYIEFSKEDPEYEQLLWQVLERLTSKMAEMVRNPEFPGNPETKTE